MCGRAPSGWRSSLSPNEVKPMSMKLGSFMAHDVAGQSYTIVMTDRMGTKPGRAVIPIELRTANGQRVNRISKGLYEIVETGVRLTSNDPNEPK
jgi:hypothetical protein